MKIEFNTRSFEMSHGRRPSGRGSWFFCPTHLYRRDDYLTHCFSFTGVYRDAKRAAAVHFTNEADSVTVCP